MNNTLIVPYRHFKNTTCMLSSVSEFCLVYYWLGHIVSKDGTVDPAKVDAVLSWSFRI